CTSTRATPGTGSCSRRPAAGAWPTCSPVTSRPPTTSFAPTANRGRGRPRRSSGRLALPEPGAAAQHRNGARGAAPVLGPVAVVSGKPAEGRLDVAVVQGGARRGVAVAAGEAGADVRAHVFSSSLPPRGGGNLSPVSRAAGARQPPCEGDPESVGGAQVGGEKCRPARIAHGPATRAAARQGGDGTR